jgi:hypothetical protein
MKESHRRAKVARVTLNVFVLLLVYAAALGSASASTVRGRLERIDGYGRHYPAPYIAVTLKNPRTGRSSPVYTDPEGMYYIRNVPHQPYVLEVWSSRDPHQPPLLFNVFVNNEPYQDIAPIIVR